MALARRPFLITGRPNLLPVPGHPFDRLPGFPGACSCSYKGTGRALDTYGPYTAPLKGAFRLTKIRDIEQVVDAAARVFAEKGYEAARLEDIATELGVLQGSLYYHIGSKAELLSLVQIRRLVNNVEGLEAIVRLDCPAGQKLTRAISEHLLQIDRYYPESLQWFAEPTSTGRHALERRAHVDDLNHRYTAAWRAIIQEGVESGDFRPGTDPAMAARLILGACNWFTRWYRKGGEKGMEELAGMVASFVRNGIASVPG